MQFGVPVWSEVIVVTTDSYHHPTVWREILRYNAITVPTPTTNHQPRLAQCQLSIVSNRILYSVLLYICNVYLLYNVYCCILSASLLHHCFVSHLQQKPLQMRDTRNLQFRLVLTRYFHIKTITWNVGSEPLVSTQPLSHKTQNNVCNVYQYLLIAVIITFVVVAVVVVVVRVLAEYFV